MNKTALVQQLKAKVKIYNWKQEKQFGDKDLKVFANYNRCPACAVCGGSSKRRTKPTSQQMGANDAIAISTANEFPSARIRTCATKSP